MNREEKKDKKKTFKEKISGVFDIIGEILAVVLVIVFALLIIDANFPFISKVPVLYNIFSIIQGYGSLVLMAVVGLEAMTKRNFILLLVFGALLALIVIFLFFPDTYVNFMHIIHEKTGA